MEQREILKQLFEENGLEKEDVFKSPQGYVIIRRTGIEKIQYKQEIKIKFIVIKADVGFIVIKAIGKKGAETIETYGEASTTNCTNKYLVAMAEKRALARAVLKLSGLYKMGVFEEDESEDFHRK